MTDTVRTRATLLTSLADNGTGAITPQVVRDVLVSTYGVYGSVYAYDSAVAKSVPTVTNTVLNTSFPTAGIYSGVTLTPASGRIDIVTAGDYEVSLNMNITNTNATAFTVWILKNGAAQAPLKAAVYCDGDGQVNIADVVTLAAGDYLTVQVYHAHASTQSVIVSQGRLRVLKVA